MDIYRIADIEIGITNHSEFTKEYLNDYKSDSKKAHFTINVTEDMINKEIDLAKLPVPKPYYELTAILRAICYETVNDYNGFFLHCSCLEYEGEAYIFTAQSGTGKSTHARLWREVFGDKVTMINDDKPIIRFTNERAYIYGTPWNGKHAISNNIKAPIKAIFYLHQADENKVIKTDPVTAVAKLLSQTILPDNKAAMNNLLSMLNKLVSTIPVYDLYCNISLDAVHTALNSVKEI